MSGADLATVQTNDNVYPVHAGSAALVMPAVSDAAMRAQAETAIALVTRIAGPKTKDGLAARDELETLCDRRLAPLFTAQGYSGQQHPLMNPLLMDHLTQNPALVGALVYTAIPRGADTHWVAGTILDEYCAALLRDIRDGQAAGASSKVQAKGAESLGALRKVSTLVGAHIDFSDDDIDFRATRTIWRLGVSEFSIGASDGFGKREQPLISALGNDLGKRLDQLLGGPQDKVAHAEMLNIAKVIRAIGDPAQGAATPLITLVEKGTTAERRAAADALASFTELTAEDRHRLLELSLGGKGDVSKLAATLSHRFPQFVAAKGAYIAEVRDDGEPKRD